MERQRRIPRVLSIAGSDSGGGAGIQADVKAIAAAGGHGMTAITALTAQNTVGVDAIVHVDPEMIIAQVRAVSDDIGVDAVKIGMLGMAATVQAVAAAIDLLPAGVPVVIDPVMVSESGATLLDEEARVALIRDLLPRASVITPNLPEARAIASTAGVRPATGVDPTRRGAATGGDGATGDERPIADDDDDAAALAAALRTLGPDVVVVTGGHRARSADVFFDGTDLLEIDGPRHPDGAAHGSGCTHSSVLATYLARGIAPIDAARAARALAACAVENGLRELGRGAGPVDVLNLAGTAPRLP